MVHKILWRPRESCSLQTAPQPAAVETSDLDEGLELHRDTTERDTPPVQSPTPEYPLTPGAARTTGETFYEPAGDMEDEVDELQAIVEEQMPWLKKKMYSQSSNPSTSSPYIEL